MRKDTDGYGMKDLSNADIHRLGKELRSLVDEKITAAINAAVAREVIVIRDMYKGVIAALASKAVLDD